MTVLHESRETYDAAKDKVGRLTLRVEHAPGQRSAIEQFLGGIATQAGVYFAEIEHEGEADGERLLQHADPEHAGAEVGQGSEPEETGAGAGLDQHEDGAVAEPAWEVAVEGPGERGA